MHIDPGSHHCTFTHASIHLPIHLHKTIQRDIFMETSNPKSFEATNHLFYYFQYFFHAIHPFIVLSTFKGFPHCPSPSILPSIFLFFHLFILPSTSPHIHLLVWLLPYFHGFRPVYFPRYPSSFHAQLFMHSTFNHTKTL